MRIIQDKYTSLDRELITQLCTYVSAFRILAKGYLPNTLIKPNDLQEILIQVKNSLHISNPDYSLVLDRLHLYYDMQLITFSIDKDMNLVIQFPVFSQPYIQKPLVLYQLETVPVPILDRNNEAQSYLHLQVKKLYIALNSETYISLRHQELRSCKKIGHEFYCQELFVVKHKTSYSCESTVYINLTTDIIKNNCNHYLLESLAACNNKDHNLVMYFIMAFANYFGILPNITTPSLIRDRTTYEQPLPVNMTFPAFDTSLEGVPTKFKIYMPNYAKHKEFFDFEQRHVSTAESLNNSNKNFFSNNYIVDIFMFTSSIVSLISTILVIYIFCKHKHIRTLVASLILHKIKEVEANSNPEINSKCRTLTYVGIILTVLSMVIVVFLHYRKSRLCKGYRFLNAIKIMLFISDVQNYVPIKLCKTAFV